MDDNGIFEYFKTHKLSPTGIRNFLAYYEGAREYVNDQVAAHPEFRTPGGYINCLIKGITLPKCVICGKTLNYKAFKNGRTHCSMKCFSKDKNIVEGRNKTNMERYGVSNPSQVKEFKDRRSATIMDRYGVDSILKNPAFVKKQKQTMIDRYGVDSYQKTDEHKRKAYDQSYETILKWGEYVIPVFTKEEYHGYKHGEIYRWKCSKCGNEFVGKIGGYGHISQNSKIPRCMNCFPHHLKESDEENEIYEFVVSQCGQQVVHHDRKILGGMEIDILIPEKKIGIEFNGLFFHNENSGKGIDYHVNKTNLCESNGIRLIHIFEDEWIENQNVVKGMIRQAIGAYDRTINSSECRIQSIRTSECDDFFESNHILGASDSKVQYGLYFGKELVCAMAFDEIENGWQMTGFCEKIGTHVKNGVIDLMMKFRQDHTEDIIAYADRRNCQYRLYEDLGFIFIEDSSPNVWWSRNKKRFSEQECVENIHMILGDKFNSEKSIAENMIENGWSRIYDCGTRKYLLKQENLEQIPLF